MSDKPAEQESRIKVGKLNINKESIEELTSGEAQQIQGGVGTLGPCTQQDACNYLTQFCDTQGGADQCLTISRAQGRCEFG